MSCQILDLADELLLSIIETLARASELPALRNLALTCRQFQSLTEPYLYRSIFLRTGRSAELLVQSLQSRAARAASIQSLDVRIAHGQERGSRAFYSIVRDLNELRAWTMESPYCNHGYWRSEAGWARRDMEEFRKAFEEASLEFSRSDKPLQNLTHLTIHSHGPASRYWSLGRMSAIFVHPSLRYIHLSCADIERNDYTLNSFPSSTPLKTLIFEECNIVPTALHSILSTPKALKHLTLGENAHHRRYMESRRFGLGEDVWEVFEALQPQMHSLEELKHADDCHVQRSWGRRRDVLPAMELSSFGEDRPAVEVMRDFVALTSVELCFTSLFNRYIVGGHIPPNVTTICYTLSLEEFLDTVDAEKCSARISANLVGQRSLHALEIQVDVDEDSEIETQLWDSGRAQKIHSWAYGLFRSGICLQLYVNIALSGFIPPYLYGERKPERFSVYDSFEIGFLRKVEVGTIERSTDTSAKEPIEGTPVGGLEHDLFAEPNDAVENETNIIETDQVGEAEINQWKARTKQVVEDWLQAGDASDSVVDSDEDDTSSESV